MEMVGGCTVYLALRCFQCQAFQVNQKTKSGKWKCRMCGEGQSILKVWGRGGRAKDVRGLVMELSAAAGRGEDPTAVVVTQKKTLDGEQTIGKSAMFAAGGKGRDGDDSSAPRHYHPASYGEARGGAARAFQLSVQPMDRALTRGFVAAIDAPGHGELPSDMWPGSTTNEIGLDTCVGDRSRKEDYPGQLGNGKRMSSPLSWQKPSDGGGGGVSSVATGGGRHRRSRWEAFASSETENMRKGARRQKNYQIELESNFVTSLPEDFASRRRPNPGAGQSQKRNPAPTPSPSSCEPTVREYGEAPESWKQSNQPEFKFKSDHSVEHIQGAEETSKTRKGQGSDCADWGREWEQKEVVGDEDPWVGVEGSKIVGRGMGVRCPGAERVRNVGTENAGAQMRGARGKAPVPSSSRWRKFA